MRQFLYKNCQGTTVINTLHNYDTIRTLLGISGSNMIYFTREFTYRGGGGGTGVEGGSFYRSQPNSVFGVSTKL